MRLLIVLVLAGVALAGCNANQTPSASVQDHYNPIDYAQTSGYYAGR